MKSSQTGNLDALPNDMNQGWSLSWKPEGYCEQFSQEAILASAPPDSGVYGLFNFDCQIFIGESPDIREVLLRLERESNFQSPRFRPTGFTFELCPEESRKQKAAQLIARYRPALQTLADLSQPSPSDEDPGLEGGPNSASRATEDDNCDAGGGPVSKLRPVFRISRTAYVVLSVFLLGSGAAAYRFFAAPTGTTPNAGSVRSETSPAGVSKVAATAASRTGAGTAEGGSGRIAGVREQTDEKKLARATEDSVRLVKSSGTGEAPVHKLAGPAGRDQAEAGDRPWSVQISSSPTREIAHRMAQELLGRGYDAYVVQAEVKGQIYHRVRAGRFAAREEAEATRQALAAQERYRDAYLTRD